MASAVLPAENEALEKLLCKSCCQIPKQKVFLCKNGHSLCASCYENHLNCPRCGSSLDKEDPTRNLFFEDEVKRTGRHPKGSAKASEDYDCPICYNLPEQEVYQCKNGHCLCASCHHKWLNIIRRNGKGPQCPICQRLLDKVNPIRNFLYEAVLDEIIQDYCAYRLNGCNHRSTRNSLQDHQSKCRYNFERFGILKKICKLLGYEGCDFCVNNGNIEDFVKHLIVAHGCVTTEGYHIQMELSNFQHAIKSSSKEILLWTPVISDLKEKKCFLLISAIFNRKAGLLACFSICIPKCNESLADLKIEFSVTSKTVDALEWKQSRSCIPLSQAESFLPGNIPCSILPPNFYSDFTNGGSLVINCIVQEDQMKTWNSIHEQESKLKRIAVCANRATPLNFLSLDQRQEVVLNSGLNAGISVKYLPDFATKEYIKNYFSDFGKVVSVKMMPQSRSTGQMSKSCTVYFEHRVSVHKVLLKKKERICMKRNGKKHHLVVTTDRLTMNTESEANTYTNQVQDACLINRDSLLEHLYEVFSATGDREMLQRLYKTMGFIAAEYGCLESMKYCLEKGIYLHFFEHHSTQKSLVGLLHYAILDKNQEIGLEKVKLLVRSGADIYSQDLHGTSLLHYSVIYGSEDMLEFFLEKGLDVNACNKVGETPLHTALLYKPEIQSFIQKVKLLLKYGADLTIKDKKGRSPRTLRRDVAVEYRDILKEMFKNHLKRVRN